MILRHIVAAVDNSEASRAAATIAARLAMQTGAELTMLSVAPAPGPPASQVAGTRPFDLSEQALGNDLFANFPGLPIEMAGVYGLPQIEIGRFAEDHKADLIVMGRKPRSRATRLFLGDTADAVVRRSRIPCLLVPPGIGRVSYLLAALDGTERGFAVFEYASELAEAGAMRLSAVTVEPMWAGEPTSLAARVLSPRTERLSSMIEGRLRKGHRSSSDEGKGEHLQVRRGEPVEEVVAAVTEGGADVLALGFHRGGPPLVIENGSVSRQLVHAVPCAVLAIPL